jgi:PmbA protein
MNKDKHDLAAWSLKHAKSAGADGCRVSIYTDRRVEVSYRERKPENIKEAKRNYLTIDVFVDGRFSNQSTSDLRPAAVKDFISNAVVTTKMLAEDPFRSLPDSKYYKGRATTDLGIFDASHKAFSPEDRHEIVKAMEAACLGKGGDKVISVTASCRDTAIEALMLSSNGFEGYQTQTYYTAGASMTAQGEGDRRPNGYNYMTSAQKSGLPSPSAIGVGAAERTLKLIGATKIKTETLPIIIENRNASRLLNGLLAGMYGSNIQQKRSFLADMKGKKIGSDHFTVIDDPLIKGGLGSQVFDNDGITAKKRTMIDKGVLKEFWVDWYYSRKLGWEPTSGRPANVVIPPGKRSIEEIMKDLGRGILITGFIGGNSNSTTGDVSVGILGQLFEEGKTVQPVSEMNIADNHLKFWQKLAEVGNDPWLYSSFRTPSLVFTDVVVSGA